MAETEPRKIRVIGVLPSNGDTPPAISKKWIGIELELDLRHKQPEERVIEGLVDRKPVGKKRVYSVTVGEAMTKLNKHAQDAWMWYWDNSETARDSSCDICFPVEICQVIE